jgi:hypothetical protein
MDGKILVFPYPGKPQASIMPFSLANIVQQDAIGSFLYRFMVPAQSLESTGIRIIVFGDQS